MVGLIFITDAPEDLNGFLLARLTHGYRLETAFQCRIFFDMLSVFLKGGSTYNLHLTPCERGFEDIRGINCALCRACSYQGVQLINKEYDISRLGDLFNGGFDTFLKISSVLCTGDHARKIQRDYSLVPESFRDFARGNLECQPLGDSSLADTRLTDEAGVILRAAAEYLYDTLNLFLSADDGIYSAARRHSGQVSSELIERRSILVLAGCG